MSKYLELAKEQFHTMKDEWLDEDRHCCGGENTVKHEARGVKVTIKVSGFWESSDWFDWEVFNELGETLEKGTEY